MDDDVLEMNFPLGGLSLDGPFGRQKPRDIGGGVYARTTPVGVNVVGFEPAGGRKRGGTRPGLDKLIPDRPEAWIVQGLGTIVTTVFDGRYADGSFVDPTDALGPIETISIPVEDMDMSVEVS